MPKPGPVTPPPPQGGAVVAAPGLSNMPYYRISASSAMAAHAKRLGDFPVKKVFLYRRDCIVRKAPFEGCTVAQAFGGGIRESIEEFSDRSRWRLLFFAKNCNCEFRSMITLTYPAAFPCDGKEVKGHLESIRDKLMRQYPGIRGIWFLEFQLRGAPHFHILCEIELASLGDVLFKVRNGKRKDSGYWTSQDHESWLAEAWYKTVGSGDEKHLRAGVSWEIVEETDGALRYAATHAAKPHQKKVPKLYQNVGRFWGKIGKLECEKIGEATVSAEDIFNAYGHEALSSRGRVVKYLFDASEKFTMDEI